MSAAEENSNYDISLCKMHEVCLGNMTSPWTSFPCFINSVMLALHFSGQQERWFDCSSSFFSSSSSVRGQLLYESLHTYYPKITSLYIVQLLSRPDCCSATLNFPPFSSEESA